MSEMLDMVSLNPSEEEVITSEKARQYIKLSKLIEQMEEERQEIYQHLSADEKHEVFESMQKKYNIPEYISVREAATILDVSVQMVRRYCAEGKIKAHQRLEGSGKWQIETNQFVHHPGWDRYVEDRERVKSNSMYFANKMHSIINED